MNIFKFKWLKRFLSKVISSDDTAAFGSQYNKIFTDLFQDTAYSEWLLDEMVYQICINNFSIDPTVLIEGFKSEGLSIDEYFVVMMKVGSILQLFVDFPFIYLKHALEVMPDAFTESELENIKEAYKHVVKPTIVEEEKEDKTLSIKDEDNKANLLIDEWLKNNKNVDTKNSGRNNKQ